MLCVCQVFRNSLVFEVGLPVGIYVGISVCMCVVYAITNDDIVEAHCYFVDIGRTDREQIRSRINNNDCRTFRPRRPLSTAYRTKETAV